MADIWVARQSAVLMSVLLPVAAVVSAQPRVVCAKTADDTSARATNLRGLWVAPAAADMPWGLMWSARGAAEHLRDVNGAV